MSENKPLEIAIADLGEEVFLRGFSGTEAMSRPFQFELDLLSGKRDLAFEDVVGSDVCVSVDLPDGEKRYFHGMVSQFVQTVGSGDYSQYQAVMVPKLWLLTRRSNCRIFQRNQGYNTIADVIFKVLDENDIEYEKRLEVSAYREWEYCVQYRETDFNFVSRLMEQEGIYYFFIHEAGKHTMVLCDSASRHETFANYEEIPYGTGIDGGPQEQITDWVVRRELQPEMYTIGDFDFKKPSPLKESADNEGNFLDPGSELFEYPGEYADLHTDSYKDQTSFGKQYAKRRIEQIRSASETFSGSGDARGILPGHLFTLKGSPRGDASVQYLVVGASYTADAGDIEAGGEGGGDFECSFEAVESAVQYRPSVAAPKPVVQGPQTATVAGASEIDVDKYGRVKVQFHWDREGKSDQDSSCWIRVSQHWAGPEWGSMHIPHKGQEVIVEFLEGDPDRPIVTGRVYNENNMPPLELPANKTQSIIRDHGSNQIVMEGAGPEAINLQQACGNEILMNAATPSIETKQACGNEILIRDGEGIQIRDSYGNEIVLDSAAGTIRLYSPTHGSEMVLGKSLRFTTTSDWISDISGNRIQKVDGNNDEVRVGWKHDTVLGAATKFVGGMSSTIVAGNETKVNLLTKLDFCEAFGFKHTAQTMRDLSKKKETKTPTLTDLVKEHKEWYDKEMTKVKEKRMEAQKAMEHAVKLEQHADSVKLEVRSKRIQKIADEKVEVAGNCQYEASVIQQKAQSTMKLLGQMIKIG